MDVEQQFERYAVNAGWDVADRSLAAVETTARRLEQHNAGTGAKYTSGRRPVELARLWPMENRSTALKAEADFKKLSRKAKFQRLAPPL